MAAYRVLKGRELADVDVSKLGHNGTMKVNYKQLADLLGPPRQRQGRPAEWVLRYRECFCCDHMLLGTIYITDGDPTKSKVWSVGGTIKAACVYSRLFKR